ncbi:restriction endonuclease subunit S [Francisellaceae bacterium]|nr:restriction endonuclease subunit S [Francisellaceae bacterium]
MSKQWKEKLLVPCLDALIDYRGKTPKKSNNGIKTLSAKSVKMGKILYEQAFFISKETYQKFMVRGFPKVGDVLLTTEAPLGCVARLDRDDVGLAQRLITIRGKEGVLDNGYLMYFLMSTRGQYELSSRASGTTVQGIKRSEFEKVKINLPPLPEQKAIANILGKLDDKIELNRQMNQTLEQMAQALFQSWFVDFDPVIDNALAAGNAIPEALVQKAQNRQALLASGTAPTLPNEIKRQFPNQFVLNDTLNKWMPEGWEVKSLGEITTELRRGISPKYTETSGVLVLNQKCIKNHEVNYSLARRNDSLKKKVDGRFLLPGDIVVNSTGTGTLGRVANIISLTEPTVVDSHVTVVRADEEKVLPHFFNGLMFSIESFIESMGEGSTGQTELSRARLSEVNTLIPSRKIQEIISNQLGEFYLKKDSNNIQTETLTKLRDTLLPQLISGKLTVPDALLKIEKHESE